MARPQAKSYRRRAAAGSSQHGRPVAKWPARLMDGFRKMLVGLFSFPPRPHKVTFSVVPGSRGGESAPKRSSCSSNLQPVNAHYDEAIADCVEFFNRSARVDVRSRPHY
ncbi:hypothetical protein BRADI_5g01855v3 [Brachypodium distachyon]|uniref:Uncharacterized protein n=1 Tax=Brachypodium distachyon TaxID=15368 RepID=A0A0Q3NYV5_BRADI|nr:hypothetical protein BRADI_5g01855v3 [Brachypodium distachyon]